MQYKQGDILIVPFPFADKDESKVRPAIVISNEKANNGSNLLVLPITSQVKRNSTFVYELDPEMLTNPLRSPRGITSRVVCTMIAPISKSRINKKVSHLKSNSLKELLAKTISFISFPHPPAL